MPQASVHKPKDESVLAACTHCGRTNRILRERLRDDPTCGACKRPVFPHAAVTGSDANWHDEVEASPLPVLVDFWAPWCGPCRVVGPVMDRIAAERGGRLKVVKLNVDENPRTAARFRVQAIPTMILFRDGAPVDQVRGAVPKHELDARLDRLG